MTRVILTMRMDRMSFPMRSTSAPDHFRHYLPRGSEDGQVDRQLCVVYGHFDNRRS